NAANVDRLILLSGDGDFDLLAEKLITKNKIVDVYGVPQLTADSLKRAASNFYPIDNNFLMKR
ncbi:MAG: NYN domain-containing protein, partial [Bacteriovorax sp.]|nr:NYN domain-containing protein [Bacteriovorax sp.]